MAKRILVAVIFIPILLVGILLLPIWAWAAAVAVICALQAFELLRATGEGKLPPPMKAATMGSAFLIPLGVWYGWGLPAACACIFVVMLVSFWCAIRAYDEDGGSIKLYHILLTFFGGGIIPLCMSSLVALQGMEHGRYLVVFALTLTFATDGMAYFGGMFLGRHRGITKVSPNKSLEGYISGVLGGAVFAVLAGVIIGAVDHCTVNLPLLALSGVGGALVSELGDLAFSLIKRQYGVKDYGDLLPGHGGMLDRFDSTIFCGPMVLFLVTYLPMF